MLKVNESIIAIHLAGNFIPKINKIDKILNEGKEIKGGLKFECCKRCKRFNWKQINFLESLVRDMQLGWCEDYYQKNYLS